MQPDSKPDLPPLNSIKVHEEELQPPRGHAVLKVVLVIIALAAAGFGVYYYYPALRKQGALVMQLPAMQNSLAAVSGRMDAAEQKLQSWTSDRDGLMERMQQVETKMSGALRAARRQTREIVGQAEQRLQAELDRRSAATDARLGQIEAGQQAEQARLAKLQAEVSSVQQEMTQQLAQARQETGRTLASLDQRVGDLDQQTGQSRSRLDALNRQLDRQRINFEVAKNHSRELAQGVSLGITKTNISYRRYSGWVWLLPDRRTLWVRNQSVQEPVIFYTKKDSRPRELVITNITKDSVVGYLLLPAGPAAAEEPAAAVPSNSAPAAQ